MSIFTFKPSLCTHCNKCMRICPVKAIRVTNGVTQIMNNYCMYCGHCVEYCPQGAKGYESDIKKVKEMVKGNKPVIVSLDPAYQGIFDYDSALQIPTALHKLGFSQVRETAEGAALVTREYANLLEAGTMDNIITSACPSVTQLVEKHYPQLIPYMAPIVSPMIAHARMLKEQFGDDVKVVYVSPCLSHMFEARSIDYDDAPVDAVIGFIDLEQWLEEENIDLKSCEETPFDNEDPKVNRLYPINGGIIRSVMTVGGMHGYEKISVNGAHNCREILHAMKKGSITHTFVELNGCAGSCVNGTCVDKSRGFRFKATLDIERNLDQTFPTMTYTIKDGKLKKEYLPKVIHEKMPTEEDIERIMKVIGRISPYTPPLDCGACGYDSCREKAIAIFQGRAEATMCLMYSYEKARSMSNLVLTATPNLIMIIDPQLHIREFNSRAEEVFKTSKNAALTMYVFDFIDSTDYEECLKNHTSITRKKKHWKDYGMTVLETIVYIEETSYLLAIIEDVTEEEKSKEKLMEKKLGTVKMAQSVIDKQMTTAQEIAGLLGETTAETKAILLKLRDYMLSDEEEV